ncbi:hypothetical protein JT26_05485 [Porphyromonas sp. COT-108 OH1349]|nr:hypothetical protein JT26_05485 [Porphyromonas sp. COT-108 OH1349]
MLVYDFNFETNIQKKCFLRSYSFPSLRKRGRGAGESAQKMVWIFSLFGGAHTALFEKPIFVYSIPKNARFFSALYFDRRGRFQSTTELLNSSCFINTNSDSC